MLHGNGGTGRRAMRLIRPAAEATGVAVLAPDSRERTWDAVTGAFGPDVRFLEQAIAEILAKGSIDRTRMALAGFSDGATYALALGRANGGLWSRSIAFSPGFLVPMRRAGSPPIFVSHGRRDDILPIEQCSRVLVPRLRRDGYRVRYHEFDGGHEVPPAIAREAVDWFLSAPDSNA
jgi:phospholipase/carboxylesterase